METNAAPRESISKPDKSALDTPAVENAYQFDVSFKTVWNFSFPFYPVALILFDTSGSEDPDSHLKRLKPNTHYSKCRYGEEKNATL